LAPECSIGQSIGKFEEIVVKLLKMTVYGLIVLFIPSCARQGKTPGPETPAPFTVYTTFYPTYEFAKRIGAGHVRVVNPCPDDADPAFWRPSPEQIAEYQKADLIVLNGAGLEQWVAQTALPESRVVDSTKPLAAELLQYENVISHSHGAGGTHAHAGLDCHTWLDPLNAQVQARQIAEALIRRLPAHKDDFEANFNALSADFDELDGEFRRLTERMGDDTLLANHPAYHYLAKRYGWKVKSFALDTEHMPSEETFEKIRLYLQSPVRAKIMLWESAPQEEIAKRFQAEFGVESVEFSPAETITAAELESGADYFTIMKRNAANLSVALKPFTH